jgi:replicative DNA helicase
MALSLAIKSGATCVYMSADSDWSTQYARSAAILTGDPVSEIQAKMSIPDPWKKDLELAKYDKAMAEVLPRIRFDFDAGPTLTRIEESARLWLEVHGRWPELIILDNLSNAIDENGGDGYQALENISAFLHELARTTQAAVVALHHLTGEHENGDKPAPLNGLRGKISKLPEVILNLYRATDELSEQFGEERLGVAIVKNRNGKANPAGKMSVLLDIDLDKMLIVDDIRDVMKYGVAA